MTDHQIDTIVSDFKFLRVITRAAWTTGVVTLLTVGGGMAGCPQYDVWQQGLAGEAELARAEQNRKIRINEAMAAEESANYLAKAEVARAKGVAEANTIIADGLGGAEGYLRWRFIEMLQETGGAGRETIYIPTEAGLPILEANRMPIQPAGQ